MSGGGALSQQVNTQPSYAPTGGKGGAQSASLSDYVKTGGGGGNVGQMVTNQFAPANVPAAVGNINASAVDIGPNLSGQPQASQAAAPNMFQQAAGGINQAMAGAQAEMGYQPMYVDPAAYSNVSGAMSGYSSVDPNAANFEAAQTTQEDIERFYNPYTSQVIDTSLADIERARMMQQNAAAAQATAAGAFGGSRGALMEAEVGRNALDQAARTASQLRNQGFTQAVGFGMQDVARRQAAAQQNAQQQMQAMLANQQTAAQVGMANARNLMQARMGNQSAALQAALANQGMNLSGSQQRLAAGQQLAALGNLGFGQAQDIQSQMMQQGALQQMLQQQIIDAAKQQYAGYAGYPQQSLGYYTQALGASQIPQSQTTTSQPGLFGWASMLLGSDIRFKENIRPAGRTAGGHNLYMWDWNDTAKEVLGEEGSSMGVIAQEVIETHPELVVTGDHGYYMVNYGGIQ